MKNFIVFILVIMTTLNSYSACQESQALLSIDENLTSIDEHINSSSLQDQLVMATKMCSKELVTALISQGADLNLPGVDRAGAETYPMFKAVKNCDVDFIKFLIDNGVDFRNNRVIADTPVVIPAIRWNPSVALFLIENDYVDANSPNLFNNTAISVAVGFSRPEVVKALLQKDGLNLNTSRLVYNPIYRAAFQEDNIIFDMLLEHKSTIAPFSGSVIADTIEYLGQKDDEISKLRIEKLKEYQKKHRR